MAPGMFRCAHVLPPAFVCAVFGIVFAVYAGLHLLPLLQLDTPAGLRSAETAARGGLQARVFTALTVLMFSCFVRTVLVDPGDVPQKGVRGALHGVTGALEAMEMKTCGGRRFCKWCDTFKPDRTHHCRVCGTCVLKMDHHCPWLMSCIGFRNHKYFFLLILYSTFVFGFVAATMAESVRNSVLEETPPSHRFFLVLGMTLDAIMGLMCAALASFHAHLMLRGMTTIEFCEKSAVGRSSNWSKVRSYDLGYLGNVCAVLGPRAALWLLPCSPPSGDGVLWQAASTSAPTVALMSSTPSTPAADHEWTGELVASK